MSTLKVDGIRSNSASSDAITLAGDGTCTANITNNLSNRNLIINGAMQVAQRGTSFASANAYTLDRWRYYNSGLSAAVTVSQEAVTDLVGFTKALKINTTTAQTGIPSTGGSNYLTLYQVVEAQNLQHIANGASGAKTITLSFWIKSNVTGTFCVTFYKPDNTNRLISLPYTINSANTWEKKTLVVTGDTSGGGINNDNGNGLALYWIWGRTTGFAGTTSTSWVDYSNAAWANTCTGSIYENVNDHVLITGVQLEVDNGSEKPTDFEHRSYGQELALCQRYYYITDPTSDNFSGGGGLFMYDSGETAVGYGSLTFAQTMRAAPTVVLRDNAGNTDGKATQHGSAHNIAATANYINENGFCRVQKSSGNFTTGAGCPIICGCTADAEL